MCRRNQLCGCVLLSLGVGVLIGTWLESGFFCLLVGLLLVFLGIGTCRKK